MYKTCCIDGCERPVAAKGVCLKHYKQIRHHGKIPDRTRLSPNEIYIFDEYAEIGLYDKMGTEISRAIIDIEDVEFVSGYKWSVYNGKKWPYVFSQIDKNKRILLHRFLLCVTNKTIQVDHKNRNPLDNRRSNLRIASNQENAFNQSLRTDGASKFKGVSRKDGKWRATINFCKQQYRLGLYSNEIEAAEAYDKKAIELFGEFACLNLSNG